MTVASALDFDPETHEYRMGSTVIPSVTQILKETGVATDFEEIASIRPNLAAAIDFKRALGTAVHADAHAYDDNDLEWASVDDRVKPYLEAWIAFRENLHAEPEARERRVFHPLYLYAGTLDGIFRIGARRVLVDLKIGDPADTGAQFQTAAYEGAYLADHPGEFIDQRWAVRLLPNRAIPYAITNYTAYADSWRDFARFQCFVTTYYAQPARRTTR